ARAVFGVILGTGVGGGIVIDGKALIGRNAIAGEWGHNPLPLPAPQDLPLPTCYCGRAGCIETYLSGPALEREHAALTGQSRSAKEIAAMQGEALERYVERLARALAGEGAREALDVALECFALHRGDLFGAAALAGERRVLALERRA